MPFNVRVPLPIFVRLPAPWSVPEYVVFVLLLPTLRATTAAEAFVRLSPPGPVSPPKVANVSDPKLKVPAPPMSSVYSARSKGCPTPAFRR